ncbi:hypothetical protein [Streptomyces sp. NPDC091217]
MNASSQPEAVVAWLSLAIALLISAVVALIALIIKTSTASRLSEALPIAVTCFAGTMGLVLAGMTGVGLLRG